MIYSNHHHKGRALSKSPFRYFINSDLKGLTGSRSKTDQRLSLLPQRLIKKSYSNSLTKRIIQLSPKPKLALSIRCKEIFVLQDGSTVTPGTKLPGFSYPITITETRYSHSSEMKAFFSYCKEFFKAKTDFRFIFSHTGKSLRCLHEAEISAKIVLVSTSSTFQGIQESSLENVHRVLTRSPCYRSKFSTTPKVMDNLNSQFEFITHKFNNENILPPKLKATRQRLKLFGSNSRLGSFEKLKLKLGGISAKIGQTFLPIHDQGIQQLRQKFHFTEGELHKLYAKFKLLVLMSCGINPYHKLTDGISKTSFVQYYSTSKELTYVLERIFDKLDSDGGGSISWEEYLSAMDVMIYGSRSDKIDLFFDVYDQDGSGTLSFNEIQELCKVQLQGDSNDKFIENLAQSFASLIFDITAIEYDGEIPASLIKEIVTQQQDKSLIDMFCNFSFLK